MSKEKYLITGGCGFLGSNIAAKLIERGNKVVVFDNLYRYGAAENLKWLQEKGDFTFLHRDIRNNSDVLQAIKTTTPDVIFHLAGQVAMTTSVERPSFDFDINVVGSFNLLEAVRQYSPESVIIYSSTNKVYGDLEQYSYREEATRYVCNEYPNGFNENVTLKFSSPYGCSKGAADQYMLDYHKMFGLKTVVFRHSSIFGGRQFSTFDQGWVGWFIQQGILQSGKANHPEFTISGTGKQVRDLLFVDDAIRCYLNAYEHIDTIQGTAYNIGGGVINSLSILELLEYLEKKTGIELRYRHIETRASDQKVFIADTTKIKADTGWSPEIDRTTGLDRMYGWIGKLIKGN